MKFPTFRRAAAFVALSCVFLGAQTPPCFELNAGTPGTVPFTVPYLGYLSVRFSPPTAVVANVVGVFAGTTQGHGLFAVLRLVEPTTGDPLDPPLATASIGTLAAPPSGWISAALTAASPLNVGETYQIDFSAIPSPTTFPASYPLVSFPLLTADPLTAATPLPYDFACFTTACAAVPTTGVLGLKMRFSGGQCGAPALAFAIPIGESCQSAGPGSTLQCLPPPIPGNFSTLLVSNTGAAGTPIYVFWSLGVDALGSTSIGPGGCPVYLDRTSLDALAAAGFGPLASGLATGFSATGLSIGWPFDPAIAGIVIGMQAVIADGDGLPTIVPGLLLRTSQGLRATIGY